MQVIVWPDQWDCKRSISLMIEVKRLEIIIMSEPEMIRFSVKLKVIWQVLVRIGKEFKYLQGKHILL